MLNVTHVNTTLSLTVQSYNVHQLRVKIALYFTNCLRKTTHVKVIARSCTFLTLTDFTTDVMKQLLNCASVVRILAICSILTLS